MTTKHHAAQWLRLIAQRISGLGLRSFAFEIPIRRSMSLCSLALQPIALPFARVTRTRLRACLNQLLHAEVIQTALEKGSTGIFQPIAYNAYLTLVPRINITSPILGLKKALSQMLLQHY